MKVRYIKSATVAVETKGVKILTDPWLTDGEYYGSWYHYPKLEFKEDYFKEIDFIYVSHIHPDHFSKPTFNLLNKSIPVLIHCYESKFLKQNIERLGFNVIELNHNERTHLKNGVYINIIAADNCNPELCAKFFGCGLVESKFGSTQIDTLSVIDDGNFFVLNTNDCPYELAEQSLNLIKKQYPKIDLMLVGYGGAGPYPQCFIMPMEDKLKAAANKKKQFLTQGIKYIENISPNYVVPFAGTYVLGGRLAPLQEFRGVPEIEEAAKYFEENINCDSEMILLNSYEFFDLSTKEYSKPYQAQNYSEKRDYVMNILSKNHLDYENDPIPAIEELKSLLAKAYSRFEKKRNEIQFRSATPILIRLMDGQWCYFTCDGKGWEIISEKEKSEFKTFVSYNVDIRLLYKILQGPKFAHWNNAEIGSHVEFERNPNIFERGLHYSMNFFHA